MGFNEQNTLELFHIQCGGRELDGSTCHIGIWLFLHASNPFAARQTVYVVDGADSWRKSHAGLDVSISISRSMNIPETLLIFEMRAALMEIRG